MVLDNINCSEVIHNKLKKCEFCGKELSPIGLDYLYANISPDAIKYERCDCNKAQEYWKRRDEQEYEIAEIKSIMSPNWNETPCLLPETPASTTPEKPSKLPMIFDTVNFSCLKIKTEMIIAKNVLEPSMMLDFTPVVWASPI